MNKFDWKEILGSDSDETDSGRSSSLGRTTPARAMLEPDREAVRHKTGYIGFTLNYPRTVKFLNATSSQQRQMYLKWFHEFKSALNMGPEYDYAFEYCKTGQVHMHGYITLYGKHFINGAVSDITKKILSHLPKSHNKFKESYLHSEYHRYRCPAICVQYYTQDETIEDKSGIRHWKTYIKKTQSQ